MSNTIVRLVAIADDLEPTDLEPLGQAIDVHASDALFSKARSSSDTSSVDVSLRHHGYRAEIDADETVGIQETSTETDQ